MNFERITNRCKEIIDRYNDWGWKYFFVDFYHVKMKYRYNKYISGELAMKKCVADYDFKTVLDIGCGDGCATNFFADNGKEVVAVDYGKSSHFVHENVKDVIIGDFNTIEFEQTFDLIWAAHVLEHQLNVQVFLEKIHSLLNEGGIAAITVPPVQGKNLLSGHVSIWTPGMLIYRMILAGFDCSEAKILKYGYNISIIVKKKTIDVLNEIAYDHGDLLKLEKYFPPNIKKRKYIKDIGIDANKISNW